jgi:hypothetical protein
MSVEIIPGNYCDFRTYLAKRARANLENAQRCSFLIMERIPGKHCDFSAYHAKRARAQSGACAEVQFPDYGTVLWANVSGNNSRK